MEKRVRLYLVVVLMLPLAILVKAQRPGDDVRPVPDLPCPDRHRTDNAPCPQQYRETSESGFQTILKPFLSENCYRCHGNKKHEKDLNFQSFTSADSLIEHRERWDEVVSKLKGSEMPPLEEDQPDEDQRQAVATWVEHRARSHRS